MSNKVRTLSESNVKFLCGLIRDVRNIDHLLNDLAISNTQTFSSLKITELAQETKHSLEQYIQSSINGLTHLKKKIVDTLPSDADAEENILYLVKDASVVDDVVYNQYLLIDGVLEPLGRTSTDLSNVYLKDEVDAKFALISNLQTLIDMVGNASDLETTAKDTLVNAINEIKEGLDDCIKKDAIATTLDDTVTNEQVIGAKDFYNHASTRNIKTYTKLEQIGLSSGCTVGDIFNAMPDNSYLEIGTTDAEIDGYYSVLDMPPSELGFLLSIRKWNKCRFDIQAKYAQGNVKVRNTLYLGTLKGEDGSELTWEKVCTTTVKDEADVNVTSSLDTTVATAGSIMYAVKNGICYVRVDNLRPLVTCDKTVILPNGTLPKASTGLCYANISTWCETNFSSVLLQTRTNGSLDLWCDSNALNKSHYGMFSYLVAE